MAEEDKVYVGPPGGKDWSDLTEEEIEDIGAQLFDQINAQHQARTGETPREAYRREHGEQ